MRKHLFLLILSVMCAGSIYGANEDNRPLGADVVRPTPRQVDDKFVIRFSTTIPADTDVIIAPDHWAMFNSTFSTVRWTSGVTYSTSPAKFNGGRSYLYFQAIEAATQNDTGQKLHWSYNTTVSTNTDPYLIQGQSYPPTDFPFVYQSSVTLRSTATFKVGGFIVTEKSRR